MLLRGTCVTELTEALVPSVGEVAKTRSTTYLEVATAWVLTGSCLSEVLKRLEAFLFTRKGVSPILSVVRAVGSSSSSQGFESRGFRLFTWVEFKRILSTLSEEMSV